jgi:hypothetical protein
VSATVTGVRNFVQAGGVLSLGIILGAAAAGFQTTFYLLNVYVLSGRADLLDITAETTLAAWAGTVAVFATAMLCLLLAISAPASRSTLLGIAAATAFLSLDDATALHERVAQTATTMLNLPVEWGRLLWPAFYLPLLLWLAAALFQLAGRQSSRVRQAILAGLTTLAAAVALEMFSGVLIELANFPEAAWPMVLEIAVEEAAELVGWILIATALGSILIRPLA